MAQPRVYEACMSKGHAGLENRPECSIRWPDEVQGVEPIYGQENAQYVYAYYFNVMYVLTKIKDI